MSTNEEKHRLTIEIDASVSKKLQVLASCARRSKTKHVVHMIFEEYKTLFGNQDPDIILSNGEKSG